MLTSACQIIKANDPGDTVFVRVLINVADFTQGYLPLIMNVLKFYMRLSHNYKLKYPMSSLMFCVN